LPILIIVSQLLYSVSFFAILFTKDVIKKAIDENHLPEPLSKEGDNNPAVLPTEKGTL
jgi:hypothetical protein